MEEILFVPEILVTFHDCTNMKKSVVKKKGKYERIRWTYQSLKLFKLFSNCCSLFMCV